MNLAETHRLLTAIRAVDNRNFDDVTVATWRQILADHEYADCATAALDHFRDDPDRYLMPGHIHRRAAALASRRAGAARRAELDGQLAIEAADQGEPADRRAERDELLARLAEKLGPSDPTVLRRREWVRAERQRQRAYEPNPHYDPSRVAEVLRRAQDTA